MEHSPLNGQAQPRPEAQPPPIPLDQLLLRLEQALPQLNLWEGGGDAGGVTFQPVKGLVAGMLAQQLVALIYGQPVPMPPAELETVRRALRCMRLPDQMIAGMLQLEKGKACHADINVQRDDKSVAAIITVHVARPASILLAGAGNDPRRPA